MDGERLNKYLSAAGICSRREADRAIEAGEVKVDGVTAELGTRVTEGQTVVFRGKKVSGAQEKAVLIAFYKPRGIVCTTSTREPDNVVSFLNYSTRIYPIGRLDKESEGLLLLTNQGGLMDEILRSRNDHEKEYEVTVNKPVTPEFCRKMAHGVELADLDTVTKPCEVHQVGKKVFTIVLTQGLNRQIRRMCETLGYRVIALKRTRIMNIRLNHLLPGSYRNVTPEELRGLSELIERDDQEQN